MSFDSALLELMPSTIRVSTRTAFNNYGEPTYTGSTVSYRARIVQKPQFVRSADGETVSVSHVAWVRSTGAVSITVDDRVTLPSGMAQGVTPRLLAVERYPDTDGIHHTKLLFGE